MTARSYLFVPGDRPERFDKACKSGADVVVIDLEDAVTPERKSLARDAVRTWLTAGGKACVRLNGTETEWFEEDCSLLELEGITLVALPKAERAEQLGQLADRLRPGVKIFPIVETALGLWNALEIAQAPKVDRLAFGSVDFQLDTGIVGDDLELLYARSRLVIASAIARIDAPVDGVTVALDDEEQLRSDVAGARSKGFGGKLCVHPRQVAQINQGFLPSAQEVAWAKAVLHEVETHSGVGAISLNGKLIDLPVIERARKLLSAAALTH
jgi:citrate lyase subunit beta/citryl-CoA lyase